MDLDEAVRLSEAPDLKRSNHDTFSTVKTSMRILIFTGKKSELNGVMRQFDVDSYVYWRSNQVKGQDTHRVILRDQKAATYARMFSEGEVRELTVGELADARNEIDVPWLPSNRGFLNDRAYDEQIMEAAQRISSARSTLRWIGLEDLAEELSSMANRVKGLRRRPTASGRP